ncbi:MAG: hypothetical protein ABEH47_04835 [Haloferacaceae archaeon]
MSDEVPDRPPAAGLVRALNLRRNAAVGAAVGVGLALLMYLVRVLELLGPVRGTRAFPVLGVGGWYLLLAVVLASATAALVTTALTLVSAYRLARETGAEAPNEGP